jgi:hypothetical protein
MKRGEHMQIDLTVILAFMGIPSAFTGLCFWATQKSLTKRDNKRDEREKDREKNELLLIRSVGAAIHAIRDGKCNGEMSAALEYAQKVKHEQKDFMTEQGVRNLY